MAERIRIAIAGVGNCASSLVQGIAWYARNDDELGLMHPVIGGYAASDAEIVAAFDIDERQVGKPLKEAVFALPNNTKVFQPELPQTGVNVQMGEVLDGVAPHMANYPPHLRFEVSNAKPVDAAKVLRESGAEILVNYVPVGSQLA